MSATQPGRGPLRAYSRFVIAVLFFFLARSMARRAGAFWASEQWTPLCQQVVLTLLLLVGYGAFGFVFDRQQHPIASQGLPLRQGWRSEAGLGLAIGWGIAVVCVFPMVVFGGIAVGFSWQFSSWGWLLADLGFFAFAAMAEEIAFRGYGFQAFTRSVGDAGAALGFAAFYAIVQAMLPGANRISVAVSIVFSLVLSTAYLRTRALWLSWGLNFGWKASRALLFGLTVSGVSSHSPVVQGDPMGPFGLSGGGFGLDGSWVAFFVLLASWLVVLMVTQELNFKHNAPVIVPGGIPVDLDAIARLQHEQAMGEQEAKSQPLVQIAAVPSNSQGQPEQPGADQTIQPE